MATFGKLSIGGTQDYWCNLELCKYPLTENGVISTVSVYTRRSVAGNYYAVIYDDVNGTPTNLKGVSQPRTDIITWAWYDFAFSPTISLPAGVYWLGIMGPNGYGAWVAFDAGDVGQFARRWNDYPPADPLGPEVYGNMDLAVSIYATYTPVVVPTHALAVTSTPITGVPFTIEKMS
jgi:hypothetical protein